MVAQAILLESVLGSAARRISGPASA